MTRRKGRGEGRLSSEGGVQSEKPMRTRAGETDVDMGARGGHIGSVPLMVLPKKGPRTAPKGPNMTFKISQRATVR
eukprot:7481793-Pyramimonas_sp.AAC.1